MAYDSDMGSKKQATSGVGVKSGLSAQDGFSGESAKSLGMDNRGKGQVPIATPRKGVSKGGKKFTCR